MYLAKLKKQNDTAVIYSSSFPRDGLLCAHKVSKKKSFIRQGEAERLLQVPNDGSLFINTKGRNFGNTKEKESLV